VSHRENVSRLLTFEATGAVVTAAKPSPRPTLLVADDSAELRRLVRVAVGASYAEIIEAADGRGLFWSLVRAYYAQPSPAPRLLNLVVLADVRMPVYDGLEVLEVWQKFQCHVPIVVITAYPDDRVRDRVTKLGGRLLAKPFSLRELRCVLDQAAA
jgi:CheY-like chemotaxis protein